MGDGCADGDSLYVYTPKTKVIAANAGNQLKLCNMRSCVQFYLEIFELYPKIISATLITS